MKSDTMKDVELNSRGFFRKMYQARMKIHKGNTTVVNLSVLYAVPCLLCAPHMTVFGIIAAMVLGYRFSFSQMDEDFASVSLQKPVQNSPAETGEAGQAAAGPSDAELSAQLMAEAEALAEKDVPTIRMPAPTVC